MREPGDPTTGDLTTAEMHKLGTRDVRPTRSACDMGLLVSASAVNLIATPIRHVSLWSSRQQRPVAAIHTARRCTAIERHNS
jgi:hypothetical protein